MGKKRHTALAIGVWLLGSPEGEQEVFSANVKCPSYFLEEERGQKRKRELDEEGEEDEDDWESSCS